MALRAWASMTIAERREALRKRRAGKSPVELAPGMGSYTGEKRVEAGKKGWKTRDAAARLASLRNLEKGRRRRRFTLKKAIAASGISLVAFVPVSMLAARASAVLGRSQPSIVTNSLVYGGVGALSWGTWSATKNIDKHYRIAATAGVAAGGLLGSSLYLWMSSKDGNLGRLGRAVLQLSAAPSTTLPPGSTVPSI